MSDGLSAVDFAETFYQQQIDDWKSEYLKVMYSRNERHESERKTLTTVVGV